MTSMKKSIKKNFIYNIVYQILTIVIPLITTPFIARVIGPTGSGIYSYTYSIVNYFVLFAMLGINNYGNRLIAKVRNKKAELCKEFTSLFSLHVLISLFVFVCYIVYTFFIASDYTIFFLIQSLYIVSVVLDINWLFFGLEEFRVTVTRNILIKLLLTLCIFVFVRSSTDLAIYILLLALSNLISNIILFCFLKKNDIQFVKITKKDVIKHLKPLFLLFIPVISLSIYKLMDKIMLGQLVNVTEVGYYEYAERIINLPMSLITALGTVMLPRMSNLVSNKKTQELKRYIGKSMDFVMFMSYPICIGIILVSINFVPWFLGDAYYKTIVLTQILALTIPVISWANVIRTQYLLPMEYDKKFTISIILGAIVNLVLNLLLIPAHGAIGASIATVCAEICVMLYQTIIVKKELDIKCYMYNTIPFLIKSIVMGIIVYFVSFLPIATSLVCVCQIVSGVFVYFIMNISYINKIFPFREILRKKKWLK